MDRIVKKRIAILTFWGVPNYGAFAQAYALSKVLKRYYSNDKVMHLAYLHKKHFLLYFKSSRPCVTSIKSFFSISYYKSFFKYIINPFLKCSEFERDWNSIEHLKIRNEHVLENTYFDIVVTGSDAIWEYSLPEFGNDVHLIGNNLKCGMLVSYAASFGKMNISDSFYPFIREGLNKYDAISVRDMNSKYIVDKLMQKDCATVVLDPTLVYDFKSDTSIPSSEYKNYILVYGNDFSAKLIDDVVAYAHKNKLMIVGAGIAPDWCDIKLRNIGPKAWIGMFKDAEFVVTCTFHGLMFGLNFEKKIVFNQVEYVKQRSTTLLKTLGLYDLYKNEVILENSLNYNWDYSLINKKLAQMRERSVKFITGIFENE